jgi:hypothetical protein
MFINSTGFGNNITIFILFSGPSGVDLRPLACCDLGFELHRGHVCFCVVYCHVEVSATS